MPFVGVRLTDQQFQKLEEVIDAVVGNEATKTQFMAEKLRLLFDNLYIHFVLRNPETVTTHKPKSERHCYQLGTYVIASLCEKCRVRSPQVYLNCPQIRKEQPK